MDEERYRRQMERLEHRRRLLNERLEKQHERINERLAKKQAELAGKLNMKQERIVEAALEILKNEGLNSLSLREIAKSLDMQAPALYWHFKSKEALIDFMAEAILQKEFADLQPRRDDETWQDWLTDQMLQLRKAMLAYPDGGRVVAGAHLYPAITLAKSLEYSLVSLESAGVDLTTARHIVLTATHYTFGYVIEEQAAPTAEQLAHIDIPTLLAPYPTMARSIKELFEHVSDRDEDFIVGLKYIIQGSKA